MTKATTLSTLGHHSYQLFVYPSVCCLQAVYRVLFYFRFTWLTKAASTRVSHSSGITVYTVNVYSWDRILCICQRLTISALTTASQLLLLSRMSFWCSSKPTQPPAPFLYNVETSCPGNIPQQTVSYLQSIVCSRLTSLITSNVSGLQMMNCML